MDPGKCVRWVLSVDVSKEPAQVPYTADVQLAIFARDGDVKGKQIVDVATLTEIVDLLGAGYDAVADESLGVVTYKINGIFSGKYATQSKISTYNCDDCDGTTGSVGTLGDNIGSVGGDESLGGDTGGGTTTLAAVNETSSVQKKNVGTFRWYFCAFIVMFV